MSKNHRKKCQAPNCLDGTIPDGHNNGRRNCWLCRGTGLNVDRWTSDYAVARYLSNSDIDSQPVCISNIRVWREDALASEDVLWRYETGGYGSTWIELDKRLDVPAEHLERINRRANELGFSSVAIVTDMLLKLENYPILSEDDESEAEMEEQQEHWESYGKDEFNRLIDDVLETARERCQMTSSIDDVNGHTHFTEHDLEETDKLYHRFCELTGFYPERIDSSAWNFGTESERGGTRGTIAAAIEKFPYMIYPAQGAQTLKDYIIEHQGELLEDEVLVCIDIALQRNELDPHIAGELLKLKEPTSTGELP